MAELPRIGEVIAGRYRVEAQIGEGGMGAVLACTDCTSDRPVALKWLRPEMAERPTAVRRFVDEAKQMGRIDHPNVIDVLDAATDPASGAPFLVMPHLRGESLAERLERGAIPEAEARRIAEAVARGVAEAHREGIVHRDLKPDNVFLCVAKDGSPREPKVLDFGVAKLRGGDEARLTRTGSLVGTPAYMAPEVLRGSRDVDPRLDVYAMGAIIYEMLSGARAFGDRSLMDLIRSIERGAPSLRERAPHVSPRLVSLVDRCLSKTASERPPHASALLAELSALNESATDLGLADTMVVSSAVASAVTASGASAPAPTAPHPVGSSGPRATRPMRQLSAPTIEAVRPRASERARRRPAASPLQSRALLLGGILLALGGLAALFLGGLIAPRVVRSLRGASAGAPAGSPPRVMLQTRQSCSGERLDRPLRLAPLRNGLELMGSGSGSTRESFAIVPGTETRTGAFPLSSALYHGTGFAIYLTVGEVLYASHCRAQPGVDPVGGEVVVHQLDAGRGLLHLELRNAVLYGRANHSLCQVSGTIQTYGFSGR